MIPVIVKSGWDFFINPKDTDMKKIICLIAVAMSMSFVAAAQKKYTGEALSIVDENGTEHVYGKGKHYIKFNGKAYGYYEETEELETAVEGTGFSNKKFAKDKQKNKLKASKEGSMDAFIFDNAGKKIGKVKVDQFAGQFTWDDPYKVVYVKGIKARPMFERMIDEGYLKP